MRNNNLNLGGLYGNTVSSVSGSVAPVSYNKDYNISTNGGLPSLIGSGSVYISTAKSDPDDMCFCPYNGFMYITQHNGSGGSSTILVMNPKTFTSVTEISVGTSIWGICYCPTNNRLYASDHGSGNLYVINPETNTSVATIPAGTSYGRYPVYCPSTQRVYFTYSSNGIASENVIACINPSTNTIEYVVTDVSLTQVGYASSCYCPINGKLYFDNGTYITVFDPVTKEFSNVSIATATELRNIRFCPNNGMLYFTDLFAHTLFEFSPVQNKVMKSIIFSQLYTGTLEFNPNNGFLYCYTYSDSTLDNTIQIIDAKSLSIIRSIGVGSLYTYIPLSLGYCPSTKRMLMGMSSGGATRVHQLT